MNTLVENTNLKVGIQHGAGYVGRELIRLVRQHPALDLAAVGSKSMAGHALWESHPTMAGTMDMSFSSSVLNNADAFDIIILCAAHGDGAVQVEALLNDGFEGLIIDMSSDLRSSSSKPFEDRFERKHPVPHLLECAAYGLPEIHPVLEGTKLIANPGCFATGIALALHPLRSFDLAVPVGITAMTGASGSGARPKATTHFPDRDGNVRAYSVFAHQHAQEVQECFGADVPFSFIPVSGPWTRGIWGTAHVQLPTGIDAQEVSKAYKNAYDDCPFVRFREDHMPELHHSVGTPFCDIGLTQKGNQIGIVFALDNLLKGAASQAIQNINSALGLDQTSGLIDSSCAPALYKNAAAEMSI
jgi:N-acetyl-gamma-glutamyl-phosphate/LysW-gamma-L-alpha-aminoadipyl-6-phosphate reductase